jgi:hypothetical protein
MVLKALTTRAPGPQAATCSAPEVVLANSRPGEGGEEGVGGVDEDFAVPGEVGNGVAGSGPGGGEEDDVA